MVKKEKPTKKKHGKDDTAPRKHEARAVDELSGLSASAHGDIAWEAPEFQEYQRGWLWILGLILVTFGLLAVFFTMDDYSAMAVTVLAAVVIYQQANQKPKIVQYRVDDEGFHMGEELLGWNQLKSFWLSADVAHSPHLYLETTHRWLPVRTIHLAKIDPAELRDRLAQYLPEHMTRGEATTDLLIRWLKL